MRIDNLSYGLIALVFLGVDVQADWWMGGTPNTQDPQFVKRQPTYYIFEGDKKTDNCAALTVKNAAESDEKNSNMVDGVYNTWAKSGWFDEFCATHTIWDCGMPTHDEEDVKAVKGERHAGQQIAKAMQIAKLALTGSSGNFGRATDCCRHYSMYLDGLLTDAGYTTDVKATEGHSVLEAKLGDKTFIVDGLNGVAIRPLDKCK